MDTGSDQSGVPAYFLLLFPDSFCGFCLSLLLPVRCRCCDLLLCICIQAFLLTAFFISASEASRDKCAYPRPVRHGAVGWTRHMHMREPPARGRPFIRSNSSCSSARLTMIKTANLQVRYHSHSHCTACTACILNKAALTRYQAPAASCASDKLVRYRLCNSLIHALR